MTGKENGNKIREVILDELRKRKKKKEERKKKLE